MSWNVTIPPTEAATFEDTISQLLEEPTNAKQISDAGAEDQAEAVATAAIKLVADFLANDAEHPTIVGSIGGHVNQGANSAGPSISIALSTRA